MRSIIKKAQVQIEGHDVNNFSDTGAIGSRSRRKWSGADAVRLLDVDGEPRAIEVTCSCGEVHLIELEFEEQ